MRNSDAKAPTDFRRVNGTNKTRALPATRFDQSFSAISGRRALPEAIYEMTKAGWWLLVAAAESDDYAGGEAKIVLMIVHAVVEARQVLVGFKGSHGDVPGDANIESAAGDHAESVRRASQAGTAGSEDSAGMHSADEDLCEGGEVAGAGPAIAGACQIRGEREVGVGAGDVGRMLRGEFAHDAEGAFEVEGVPDVSAVERETSTASRRRVAPDIVVVNADIHAGGALRMRGRGRERAEAESHEKQGDDLGADCLVEDCLAEDDRSED